MKRGNFRFVSGLALLCLPLVMLAVSCGGGGGEGGGSTGTMNLSLTDASTPDYQAIYVTIKQVEVHRDGGSRWEVVSTPNKTYNLLELVNGVREELALATLATGHYTQMRLILSHTHDNSINILSVTHPYANYFIDSSGGSIELKVPSGFQTGIKIVKGFDINTNETTELILDFDAARSIVKAGSSGKWLLKPTIKLLDTQAYSIISGNAGEPDVLVSAQTYRSSASLADRVQVQAASLSDINGDYKLFLEPGDYTLVGYKDGNSPFFSDAKIKTTGGNTSENNDFVWTDSPMGTLNGKVSISNVDPEQHATVSIRQEVIVGGITEQIEIWSLNALNGVGFGVSLPHGDYTAVASSYPKEPIEKPFTIPRDPADILEFDLQ